MSEYMTLEKIESVTTVIRKHTSSAPQVGMILGSGLGALADAVEDPVFIPYETMPGWPVSTVQGHQGRLVIGTLDGVAVIVMQGRAHYYEGYSIQQIGLPVRAMQNLGIKTLIVTNAAGAVNPDYEPGDLMLITDHLNLLGMAGLNPLRGPNLDSLGPRFPDMSQAYDRELIRVARQVAENEGVHMHEGIYACLAGPSFETTADLRFLRAAGVDAVGMSTVPEVTVARHSSTRVLGISGISNKANLDGNTITTHEEVLAAGKLIAPRLVSVVRGVLAKMTSS